MKSSDVLLLAIGFFLIVSSLTFFAPQHYMMAGYCTTGTISSTLLVAGIVAIAFALLSVLFADEKPKVSNESNETENDDKIRVVEKLLEEDEMKVFRIIYENEGITQDSLHFRTGFSQSKISMIVKKLEDKDLIYRERFGKTYRIYLSDWLKK